MAKAKDYKTMKQAMKDDAVIKGGIIDTHLKLESFFKDKAKGKESK